MGEPILRHAAAIGLDDLRVAEPVRPPGPAARLALHCGRKARLLGRAPRLELSSDSLVLTAPAVLEQPLVVARDLISVAIVDTREREGGTTLRFPYAHEFDGSAEPETYGWFYVRGGRSPLPLLADVRCLPNLVVVFSEPLPGPACRGRGGAGSRSPRSGRPMPGFFTRASDPDAARVALRDWGVMRGLTVADAERVGLPVSALVR
jgi:hypothetical protein